MLNHHYYQKLLFASAALIVCGFTSHVNARASAQEIEFPSLNGWHIEAIRRGSVMCSARQREESSISMTLLADTGKYRGGVWFLGVVSRNQHLEPGVDKIAAHLFLNGKLVVTGAAVATSGSFVGFEFTEIDAYIAEIKSASVIEIQAQGLIPQKLESLSSIITAIENCQQKSSNPEFWKDAKHVCN